MGRVIIGAAVAAAAMFLIGFLFYASGIENIAFRSLDNGRAASIQQALAANLGDRTGTYQVPSVSTPEQTSMYGRGPIATVHYNFHGFPAVAGTALVAGLVLDFGVALVIGIGLLALHPTGPPAAAAERAALFFAVAASAYINLKEPLFFHHDWLMFVYQFVADAAALGAAGYIIARWFLPRADVIPAPPPQAGT